MTKAMFGILLTLDLLLIAALIAGRLPVRGDIRSEGWVFRDRDPALFWTFWGIAFGATSSMMAVPLIRGTLQ